jgi:RNA polymerase sigma factor (sigma-70 family)
VNQPTDQIIINKVLAGELSAYRVLVDRYGSMVFTLAYNIILNREDAEEVAQDVFVKAFTSLQSFKQQSKFSTWLYRIVVNTALNKKKLHKLVTLEITEEITSEEELAFTYTLPQYESKDMKQFVQSAVGALPDNERICITLFYLNELSVNEICELTGITTANIKVLLHRGRKHLYDKLNELLKTELSNLR